MGGISQPTILFTEMDELVGKVGKGRERGRKVYNFSFT